MTNIFLLKNINKYLFITKILQILLNHIVNKIDTILYLFLFFTTISHIIVRFSSVLKIIKLEYF